MFVLNSDFFSFFAFAILDIYTSNINHVNISSGLKIITIMKGFSNLVKEIQG